MWNFANHTISELSRYPGLERGRVEFVEGRQEQIEYACLFPHVKAGGWLIIDDLQIPSVHELFRFLLREPGIELEEVVARTTFFRKLEQGTPNDAGPVLVAGPASEGASPQKPDTRLTFS